MERGIMYTLYTQMQDRSLSLLSAGTSFKIMCTPNIYAFKIYSFPSHAPLFSTFRITIAITDFISKFKLH